MSKHELRSESFIVDIDLTLRTDKNHKRSSQLFPSTTLAGLRELSQLFFFFFSFCTTVPHENFA